MKFQPSLLLAAMISALGGQLACAATFDFQTASPTFFEGRWGITDYWAIQAGTGPDDGTPNIPDGLDTVIIDRNPNPVNGTKLVLDGGGTPNPLAVAGITATGASGIDIQIKTFDLIVGDLQVLASAETLIINNERDRNLIINGVLSGSGNLELSRSGGFSDGVTPDEVFLLTGTSQNTITGSITLRNTNSGGQPCYFVADKTGAFGQTPTLTLEGRVDSGVTSLQFTANSLGDEGAIDDDATTVFIGVNGVLSVDAGVDEKIGIGKLFVDPSGTGTFTEVLEGIYDNTEDWIIGDGTITVGVPPVGPTISSITDIGGDVWELTLEGSADTSYEFRSSTDLVFDPGTLVEPLSPGVPAVGIIGGSSNTVITDGNGDATVRMTLTGSRNFVVAQIPGPLLSENFDSVALGLPVGWATSATGTSWEVGDPTSGSASGPAAANSAPNCAGTVISSDYAGSSDYSLLTPVLAIPAAGATLNYQQFIDSDEDGDVGTVRILDADNANTLLEALNPPGDIEGVSLGWSAESFALPASAAGKNVKIEFRFVSNANGQEFGGFYIDDVEVIQN